MSADPEEPPAMIHTLSIIVSVYNEEAVLDQFIAAVLPVLQGIGTEYELIFSDDGSRDASPAILDRYASQNSRIKVIHFSRNYGHEYAMIAGIDYARGDGLICMDADLQHPVELIPAILEKFQDGYEIISMVRKKNEKVPVWKKITSAAFYKLMNRVSDMKFEENASDFFGMTRIPAQIFRDNFRESGRYLRAFIQSVGFRKTVIEYEAHDRAAGKSKYNFRKLLKFSLTALISFSDFPLKLAVFAGVLAAAGGILLMFFRQPLYAFLSLMFAAVFFLLGIMGKYISVILTEVRKRPLYTVSRLVNIPQGKLRRIDEPAGTGPSRKEAI